MTIATSLRSRVCSARMYINLRSELQHCFEDCARRRRRLLTSKCPRGRKFAPLADFKKNECRPVASYSLAPSSLERGGELRRNSTFRHLVSPAVIVSDGEAGGGILFMCCFSIAAVEFWGEQSVQACVALLRLSKPQLQLILLLALCDLTPRLTLSWLCQSEETRRTSLQP